MIIGEKGNNRPKRRITHPAERSPGERVRAKQPIPMSKLPSQNLPPLPAAAFVLIPVEQKVVDRLDAEGILPQLIYFRHESFPEPQPFDGFVISEALAREICTVCYDDLCQCDDKWRGPFVLGRITAGRTARPLHRTELPIEIPQAME